MQIDCPNPANNSLIIKPENLIMEVAKLVGWQDLETGNSSFDNAFLLQSNNPHFFKNVLNTILQRQLLETHLLDTGVYEFKPKTVRRRKELRKIKENPSVLHLHLTKGKPTPLESTTPSQGITPLVYRCSVNGNLLKPEIHKLIKSSFKSCLALAQSIEKSS